MFNPDIEMQKIKDELNELIDTTEGKDNEMYREILGFAEFVEDQGRVLNKNQNQNQKSRTKSAY